MASARWIAEQLGLGREPVLNERECAARGGSLRGGTVCPGYGPFDHRDTEKPVVDGQVASQGAGCLGVPERLLDQIGDALSTPLERGAKAGVLTRELAECVRARHVLD